MLGSINQSINVGLGLAFLDKGEATQAASAAAAGGAAKTAVFFAWRAMLLRHAPCAMRPPSAGAHNAPDRRRLLVNVAFSL